MEKEFKKETNHFMKIRKKLNNRNEVNQTNKRWNNFENSINNEFGREENNPFKSKCNYKKEDEKNNFTKYSKFMQYTNLPKEKKEEKKEFDLTKMEKDFPKLS